MWRLVDLSKKRRRSFRLEKSVRTAIAVPMANDPPFATLNHVAGDLGIPSESALLRIGISGNPALTARVHREPAPTLRGNAETLLFAKQIQMRDRREEPRILLVLPFRATSVIEFIEENGGGPGGANES
jgi:hypothetical protein